MMNKNITIKDILDTPKFNSFKILAGEKGLNRKASSITIMDAPDPFPWTKGGEIVLSSGYIFKININKICNIIMDMHKSGI
ncbi:MAG: hypothetical protein F8N39_12595 [Clostridiaceae bacterium]|nr:hypothetical protein [Clostridiaceae bacterium]